MIRKTISFTRIVPGVLTAALLLAPAAALFAQNKVAADAKKAAPAKADQKKSDLIIQGTTDPRDGGRRHFLVAFGGSANKIFGGPGASLDFGYGGTFMFQYNFIARGFGIELKADFYNNPDKKYKKDYIRLLPALVSPLYKFTTGVVDIDLSAGAGVSYSMARSGKRLKLLPSADPGQPLSGIFIAGLNGSSIDLAVGAGFALSHTFNNGFVLGLRAQYYFIFQSLSAHAAGATLYLGYAF